MYVKRRRRRKEEGKKKHKKIIVNVRKREVERRRRSKVGGGNNSRILTFSYIAKDTTGKVGTTQFYSFPFYHNGESIALKVER